MKTTPRLKKSTLTGLLALSLLSGCAITPPGEPSGWTPLYDKGSNLNDWTMVGDANWRLQDDALVADFLRSKMPSYLVSMKTHSNFQIRAEFWVDSQTNSGIFIRCQDPTVIGADNCYEVNIWDSRPDPSYGTGAIVNVAKVVDRITGRLLDFGGIVDVSKLLPLPRAGGQWNVMEITAQDDLLVVQLNGTETVRVRDGKWSQGHIALQYGSGIVKFRQVLIKPL